MSPSAFLGAQFSKVAIDELLGTQHVRRIVAVYDIGTLLSGKTAKSQLIGGIVWDVNLAPFEETTLITAMEGRSTTMLAEYYVLVNADLDEIDVITLNPR